MSADDPKAVAAPQVGLRALLPQDSEFVYHLVLKNWARFRTRFNGVVPRLERCLDILWDGAFAILVVEDVGGDQKIGIATAWSRDHRNGTADISVVLSDDSLVPERALWSTALFVRFLLEHWRLRKLYCQPDALYLAALTSCDPPLFISEGTYQNHRFENGTYLAQEVLACHRPAAVSALKSLFNGRSKL